MVVGITRSFNEDDAIEGSLRRMAQQVNHIYVGDNSTDGTREIIHELIRDGLPISLFDDHEPNFRQREVMTAYAHRARDELGATWVVPFDIDEIWRADEGTIAYRLGELPDHILLAPAALVTYSCTDEDDPTDPDPFSRLKWRDVQRLPLPKVACRTHPGLIVGHGNHDAAFEGVRHPAAVNGLLGAAHFPYRSPEQLIKRVRGTDGHDGAYQMLKRSGLPRSHGLHMWEMGEHWEEYGDEGLRRWFANGMHFTQPAENPNLVFDPLPPLSSPGEVDASIASVSGAG